jgi:hypothetical protein
MFWFILLLLIIGTGFYLNSSAREVDPEIKFSREQPSVPEKVEPAAQSVAAVARTDSVSGQADVDPFEIQILEIVASTPGMKQTDLYPQMTAVGKKALQQMIRDLAAGGKLRREKSGSSYLLYPRE